MLDLKSSAKEDVLRDIYANRAAHQARCLSLEQQIEETEIKMQRLNDIIDELNQHIQILESKLRSAHRQQTREKGSTARLKVKKLKHALKEAKEELEENQIEYEEYKVCFTLCYLRIAMLTIFFLSATDGSKI